MSRQRTQQVQGPPGGQSPVGQEDKAGQGGVRGWRWQGAVERLGWGLRILSRVQGEPLMRMSSGSAVRSPFRLGVGAQGRPQVSPGPPGQEEPRGSVDLAGGTTALRGHHAISSAGWCEPHIWEGSRQALGHTRRVCVAGPAWLGGQMCAQSTAVLPSVRGDRLGAHLRWEGGVDWTGKTEQGHWSHSLAASPAPSESSARLLLTDGEVYLVLGLEDSVLLR